MEIKIEIKNLKKSFLKNRNNTLRVLEKISMTVNKGEIAVLLGPSGCGKSTLLRIVAGLEHADDGEVIVNGESVKNPDRSRGMVFQSYTSFPWLTTHENILFGLNLTRKSNQEKKEISEKYIKLVGLEGFENNYPSQLSGGMKQRVALARTLAVNPDILLLDEPFGALDSQTRLLMHELLLDIWERDHKTVLFVTHDIEEAIFLADDIYICSARPAKIKKEIKIEFERPRIYELRTKPEFNEVKREIHNLLRAETQKRMIHNEFWIFDRINFIRTLS